MFFSILLCEDACQIPRPRDYYEEQKHVAPQILFLELPSTPKCLQYKKNLARNYFFVKLTKNILQPPAPKETKTPHWSGEVS